MNDIPRKERSLIGSLLDNFSGEFPPSIARLLKHAPESFDDLRNGRIAAEIWKCSREKNPFHSVAIGERLNGESGGALYLMELCQSALPVETVEAEAVDIWTEYQRRGALSVLGEAIEQIQGSPSMAGTVIEGTINTLGRLAAENQSISQRLSSRKFNFHNKPQEVQPRFWLAEKAGDEERSIPMSTPGNLTVISGPPKAAKSAVVGAMLAAIMTTEDSLTDCLGFRSINLDARAVLHFDTEQSIADHHSLVLRELKRAGITEPPLWFKSYCLTGFPVADVRLSVSMAMAQAAKECGGIHSVFIDGYADLVCDVNDPEETGGLVSEHHGLAIQHNCPILGVIHLNPGTEKTRGHLGSQLERKAETNLRLERDGEALILWSDKNRRAPISKDGGPRFVWSNESGMFVTTENRQSAKDNAERESLAEAAMDLFSDRPSMRRNELETTIKETLKVSIATAGRKVNRMLTLGVIEKSVAGLYVLKA